MAPVADEHLEYVKGPAPSDSAPALRAALSELLAAGELVDDGYRDAIHFQRWTAAKVAARRTLEDSAGPAFTSGVGTGAASGPRCQWCGRALVEVDNPMRRELRHRRGEEAQCPGPPGGS